MGDKPGHQFRGNQYTGPEGASGREAMIRAHMAENAERERQDSEEMPRGELRDLGRGVSEDEFGNKFSTATGKPVSSVPDLDHLKRENAMPAKISDVPEGGPGVYKSDPDPFDRDKSEPTQAEYAYSRLPEWKQKDLDHLVGRLTMADIQKAEREVAKVEGRRLSGPKPTQSRAEKIAESRKAFDRDKSEPTQSRAEKIAESRKALDKAYELSRAHSKLAEASEKKYGAKGPVISGSVREHFPKPVKDKLRKLARGVSENLDKSRAAWKGAGKRSSTWQKERQAVISKKGRGFYG
jgi:hypothetical protein